MKTIQNDTNIVKHRLKQHKNHHEPLFCIDFTIKPKNDRYVANLTFDRTKYDVTYRSGNFFENLGDRLILDEVELLVDLVK